PSSMFLPPYRSANLTDADMVVLALDADNGELAWEFTWGQGFGYEEVDGLAVDGDYLYVSLYVSGWTTGKNSGNDLALLKLDKSGRLVWVQTWGGKGWDEADGQLVVRADSVYVAGRYGGKNMLLGGKGLVARFSKDTGELRTHETRGGPLFTDALGMTADAACLYVVGLTLDKGKGGQIFLRKYDPGLRLLWEQVWGGPKSESARAVTVDGSGDVLVAGESDGGGGEGERRGSLYPQRPPWPGSPTEEAAKVLT
ncbi:MAG: PQQ-like beta-propeller repeat protein, partial [Actinobacteria bacterium]|nr:PQQ-like beta-propeller repeat protein [Actinomycetota bacterium]